MQSDSVVLCATDFSEPARAAIEATVQLARHGVAGCVYLLHVLDLTPTCASAMDGVPPQIEPRCIEAQRQLAVATAALRAQLVDTPIVEIHSLLCGGEASAEILAVARDVCADVLVVGSDGRNGVGRMLLGSVSAYVVGHATCTVVTARVPCGQSASIDGSVFVIPARVGRPGH